jgi:hypothetical protein
MAGPERGTPADKHRKAREQASRPATYHVAEEEHASDDGIGVRCEKGQVEERSAGPQQHVGRKRVHCEQTQPERHHETH